MTHAFKPAFILLLAFSLITGVLYPLLVTVAAQFLMPTQANGSLVMKDNHAVSSALIGQPFSRPDYFWGRPSATSPNAYNAGASSGSNVGPSNLSLVDAIKARIVMLRAADPTNTAPVPIDLVTTSGSGLDPHISLAAAEYQINRISKIRKINPEQLRKLVQLYTEGRQWGLLGEPRVNVLNLNLALSGTQINTTDTDDTRYSLPHSKVNISLCKKEALLLHPGKIEKERILHRHGDFWMESEIQANDGSEWLVMCDLSKGTIMHEQKLFDGAL